MATDPRAGRYARLACKPHALVPVSEGVPAPAALSPFQAKLRNYRRTIEKRSAQRLHNSAYSRPSTGERGACRTPRRADVEERARSPSPTPQDIVAIARVGSPRLCQTRPTAQRRHPDNSTPEIGQVPSSSSSAPPPRYSAGTRLAILEWASAVKARFGKEDTVRGCAKWLALSCNTKGGALHNLTDLQAACKDLGMAANDVTVVAASLWEGLSVQSQGKETLPASVLLEVLGESEELEEAPPSAEQRSPSPAHAQVTMEKSSTPRGPTVTASKPVQEDGPQPKTPPRDERREGADARWRARLLHPADRTSVASTPPPLATSPPPGESPALCQDEVASKPSKPSSAKKQSTKDAFALETPVKGGARQATRPKKSPTRPKAKEGEKTADSEAETPVLQQTPLTRRLRKAGTTKLDDMEDTDATPKAGMSAKPPKRRPAIRTYLSPNALMGDGRSPQAAVGRTSRSPSILSVRTPSARRRATQVPEEEESPKGGVDAEVKELFHNLFQVTHDKVVEQETQEKELQGPSPERQSPSSRRRSVFGHRRSRVGREGMLAATPEALRRTNRRAQSATMSPLEPPPLDRGVSKGRKRRGSVDHRYDLLTRVQPADDRGRRRGSLIPGLRARLEKEKQMSRAMSDDLDLRSRESSGMRSPGRSGSKLSPMRATMTEGMAHSSSHHKMQDSEVAARIGSKGSARAELMRRKEKAKQQVQAAKETKQMQARLRRANTAELMTAQLRQDLSAVTIQAVVRGARDRARVQEFLFQGQWCDEENSPGWRFQVLVLPAEFKKERGLARVKFTVLQAPLEYMEFLDRSVLLYLRGKWQPALNTYVGEGLYAEHRILEDVLQLAGSHFTFVFRNNACSCTDHYGYTFSMTAQRTDPARATLQEWHGLHQKVGTAGSLLKGTVKQWRGEASPMTRTTSANMTRITSAKFGQSCTTGARTALRPPDLDPKAVAASQPLGEAAEARSQRAAEEAPQRAVASAEVASAAAMRLPPCSFGSVAHAGTQDAEEDAASVKTVSPHKAEEEDLLFGQSRCADGAIHPTATAADKDASDRRSSFESSEVDPVLPTKPSSQASRDAEQSRALQGQGASSSASLESTAEEARPALSPEQVLWLQERSAAIVNRAALSVAIATAFSAKGPSQPAKPAIASSASHVANQEPLPRRRASEGPIQAAKPVTAHTASQGPILAAAPVAAGNASKVTNQDSKAPESKKAELPGSTPPADEPPPVVSQKVAEASALGPGNPEAAAPCDSMRQSAAQLPAPTAEQTTPAPLKPVVLPITARPQPPPKPPPLPPGPPPLGPPPLPSDAYVTVPMEAVLAAARNAQGATPQRARPRSAEAQPTSVQANALTPLVPLSPTDDVQGQRVSMDTLLQAVRSARQAQETPGSGINVRSASAMSSTGTGDASTSGTSSTQRSKTDWSAPIRTGGSALLSAARTLFRSSISAR